jgi:geranylgeranyl diphosphate synthase type 3
MENEAFSALPSPTYSAEPLGSGNQHTWSSTKESMLRIPYDYLESQPGNDVRSKCVLAFNALLNLLRRKLTVTTRAVSVLHKASLL